MVVKVLNFTSNAIDIEPFYISQDGKEESQKMRTLPKLGQTPQCLLGSKLDEHEVQDCFRLKDNRGDVVLDVVLSCEA